MLSVTVMLTFVPLSPSVLPSESRRCDLFIKFYYRIQSRPLICGSPPASCDFFSFRGRATGFTIISGQSGGYSSSVPICYLGDFPTLLHHLFLSAGVGLSLQQYPVYPCAACCAMYLLFSLSFGCLFKLLQVIWIRSVLRPVWFVSPCGQCVQRTGRWWSELFFCDLCDDLDARTLLLLCFSLPSGCVSPDPYMYIPAQLVAPCISPFGCPAK